jgi:hypothetical protein
VPISSLGCWFFGAWVFWVPCRFWILVSYQMSSWISFCPILWAVSWVWWLFSFAVQKLFNMMQSHLFIVSLRCWAFWVLFWKLFPIIISSSVFPIGSWSCFKISGLIFRSLIHFELILIQGERQGSSFRLLHLISSFLSSICWRGCHFSIMYFGLLCWRSVGYRHMGLCIIFLFWSIHLPVCFVPIPCCFYCYVS